MNEVIKAFLGEEIVNKLPVPKKIDPTLLGTKLPNNRTECVSQTRSVTVTPQMAAELLMSNQWVEDNTDKNPNRTISKSRADGELVLLHNLMVDDQFAPHRGVLGMTEDGRLIEGQGRMFAQIKAGKTYEYTLDVVKSSQSYVSQYLASTRGTTATTSLSQLWEINFGLSRKEAGIAQQIFNGTQWHDEGILGSTVRSSTKAAVCGQTTLRADIREAAEFYAHVKVPRNINASALATIEVLAKRAGLPEKKITEFRDGVLTGNDLSARDPRKEVREFLANRAKGRTVRYQAQIGYMKAAFDKFLTNSKVNSVPYLKNGTVVKFWETE